MTLTERAGKRRESDGKVNKIEEHTHTVREEGRERYGERVTAKEWQREGQSCVCSALCALCYFVAVRIAQKSTKINNENCAINNNNNNYNNNNNTTAPHQVQQMVNIFASRLPMGALYCCICMSVCVLVCVC